MPEEEARRKPLDESSAGEQTLLAYFRDPSHERQEDFMRIAAKRFIECLECGAPT